MATDKILEALKSPLAHREDKLGNEIKTNVCDIMWELKDKKLDKNELKILESCYQVMYQDSMGSSQVLVGLGGALAGIDICTNAILSNSSPCIRCILFGIGAVIATLSIKRLRIVHRKIQEVSKDNASLRNHIMAIAILLEETKGDDKA